MQVHLLYINKQNNDEVSTSVAGSIGPSFIQIPRGYLLYMLFFVRWNYSKNSNKNVMYRSYL